MQITKVRFILLLILLVIVLTACNDDADEKESATATEDQEETNMEPTEEKPSEQENEAEDEKDKEEVVRATYEVNENWFVQPKDGEKEPEDVVLITIDDAPDEHAVEMAEKLDKMDVPAIFFVNGHFLKSDADKERLKKIDDLGFSIGNHTMTHPDLTTISEEEQKEEILGVNELVEDIIGKKPKYFRAPYGSNTDYTKKLAKEEDMLLMNWVYGYDWDAEYQEAEALADIMVNTELLDNGAILLMHDRDWTNEALEDIVTGLQDKGYDMLDPEQIITENDKNNE